MSGKRTSMCVLVTVWLAASAGSVLAQDPQIGFVSKLGVEVDVRSGSRILADELASSGNVILPEIAMPVSGAPADPQIQFRGGNVQVNNPSLDYIQIFSGFRPFVHTTQSETSSAAFGRNIVVTYNNSAGAHYRPNPSGPGVVLDQLHFSGYSVSNDGGQTWTSAYMPPITGASETLGDPSIGVDRLGVFYFAQLAVAASGKGAIGVNKSVDGGRTFGPAVMVQEDNGSDKEWLAVGPDPVRKNRDNVYVTWTSFQSAACELRFGRSIDGGQTWVAKTIFVPTAGPTPQSPTNCLTFSNIVVDPITGVLYIPFLRFSNANQDFIQLMISEDAGETFRFAEFNIPGAPSTTVLPVTQPGELTACGGTNIRLTIHGPTNPGPGRFGYPRFVNASRLTLQPAFAARNGKLYMAWNNSTSLLFGDATANSNILFMGSNDGGKTWTTPVIVNPITTNDKQHVLPSLAIDDDPTGVHVTYYTQHANGSVDLDMANSHDGGATFPIGRTVRVTSTSSDLPPTNVALTNAPAYSATNYDRTVAVCYALGEYQSVTSANGHLYVAWGDDRNLMTQPVSTLDPISGQQHPEEDVFFQIVQAQ